MSRIRRRELLLEVLGGLTALAAAWIYTEHAPGFYVYTIPHMLRAFWDTWFFEHFTSDLVPSVTHVVVGFALSVVFGVAIGVMVGSWRTLRLISQPVLTFLRSLPGATLVPAAAVIFGLGSTMRVAVIVFVAIWPVLLNTIDGVIELDPTIIDTARAYRVSGWRRLVFVTLPALSPRIAAAGRTSLSICILTMVISESVAAPKGIGFMLLQSENNFRIDEMWAVILMMGLLGLLLNMIYTMLERRALRWYLYAQRTVE